MKKLLFFATLSLAFLLPSLANACQGTILVSNAELISAVREFTKNCNIGDSVTFEVYDTDATVTVTKKGIEE